MSRKLDRLVSKIGHYFGVISKDGFVSLLLQDDSSLSSGFFDIPDPSAELDVASILMDITEGGLTTPMLLDNIAERSAGEDTDASNIGNVIKICYEPNGDWNESTSNSLLTPANSPGEGALKQGVSDGEEYSLRKIAGLPESSNVNSNEGKPAAGHPSMSVIQVLSSRFSPANRDTGALGLFLNAMPTLEMSRAVPFLDIVLIQEGDMLKPAGETGGTISKLSLGQFLMGNTTVENDSWESKIVSAKDAAVINEQERDPDFTDLNEDGEIQPQAFSTAGMEMFTSPQTLINANEIHEEYNPPVPTDEEVPNHKRAASVIDRFRPFMSLNSLSLGVAPSGGMMSYKSGKLKFTLHDRSRLSEIAAFVKPSMLRSTHMLIEYGWAHPDAKVHGSSTEKSRVIFGEFIGSLRSKEKYQVVNSSFSFDDVGQVEVELQLSMLSSRAAKQVQIGMGEASKAEFQRVKEITDLIATIRGRMDAATAASLSGDGDVLGALSNPAGAINLDEDTRKAIQNIQRAARNSDNSTLTELGSALGELSGGNGASRLENSIEEEIRSKTRALAKLNTGGDPFFLPVEKRTGSIRTPSGATAQTVSLGKLLSVFIGVPVCSTNFYDDIQIICYNINDKASYMRNRNIATFPINVAEFKTELEKSMESLVNMTIEGFVGFVNNMFISDPAAKAYGFEGMYKSRDDEDRSQRQLADRYEDDSAALFAEEQNILKHAYSADTSEASLQFKMPTIQMYMETVPGQTIAEKSTGGSATTILRIHLFDSQNTSYSSTKALLDSVQDSTMGLITPAAIAASRDGAPTSDEKEQLTKSLQKAVDAGLLEAYPADTSGGVGTVGQRFRMRGGLSNLKNFIMRTVPSVRYGQEASGIISAQLASMSDPSLTTVNMLRNSGGPEDPAGARATGLPLRVAPVQLTLKTIGCPIWNFGQQIFVDFGTGTTVDNMYAVVGIDHTIAQGEYESTVKLVQLDSYGKFESLVDVVNDAMVAIEGIDPATGEEFPEEEA